MQSHCQVCGRAKPTLKDGTIARHHFRGELCLGAYSPPYEVSGAAITSAEQHWTRQAARYALRWDQHRAGRTNEPLPASFWAAWAAASREVLRLRRRELNWARRYLAEAA